jgi:hypothetical protein
MLIVNKMHIELIKRFDYLDVKVSYILKLIEEV